MARGVRERVAFARSERARKAGIRRARSELEPALAGLRLWVRHPKPIIAYVLGRVVRARTPRGPREDSRARSAAIGASAR